MTSAQRPITSDQRLANSHILIIALTASTREEKRAAILAAGCDDIVYKPFREDDVFRLMQSHLGVRYVYDECSENERRPPLIDPAWLSSKELAKLPKELVTALEDAVERSSKKQITAIIEDIRPHHAQVAEALAHLAHDFKYDDILAILHNSTRTTL